MKSTITGKKGRQGGAGQKGRKICLREKRPPFEAKSARLGPSTEKGKRAIVQLTARYRKGEGMKALRVTRESLGPAVQSLPLEEQSLRTI